MNSPDKKDIFSDIKEKGLLLYNGQLKGVLKSVLDKKASFRFRVKGFSMSPFIRNNDVVVISPLPRDPIGLGKTIAFNNPETEKLAIHRIVGRTADTYIVKGDNSFNNDGVISREDVLGYVSRIERNDKKILFGLGAERFFIAILSRSKLIPLILRCLRPVSLLMRRP